MKAGHFALSPQQLEKTREPSPKKRREDVSPPVVQLSGNQNRQYIKHRVSTIIRDLNQAGMPY